MSKAKTYHGISCKKQWSLLEKLWKPIPIIFTLSLNLGDVGKLVGRSKLSEIFKHLLPRPEQALPTLLLENTTCSCKSQPALLNCLTLSVRDRHLPIGTQAVCPAVNQSM